jgi:hypothetical protein
MIKHLFIFTFKAFIVVVVLAAIVNVVGNR